MIIFTDGSTLNNGKKDACGGFSFYIPPQEGIPEIRESYALASTDKIKVTNNIAELLATIIGIQVLVSNMKSMETIYVYTDSNYVIKAATEYHKKWITSNWQTKAGKPVQNLWLVFHLIQLSKKYPIIFNHVDAHQEKPTDKNTKEYVLWKGNDVVDKLARGAATDLSNASSDVKIVKWSNLACRMACWMKQEMLPHLKMPHMVAEQVKKLLVPTQVVDIDDIGEGDVKVKSKKKSLKGAKHEITDV